MAIALRGTPTTSGSVDVFQNSNATNVPTGAAIGDIAILVVETWTSAAEPTATFPAGFTEITGAHATMVTTSSVGNQSIRAAWKRLSAADTGTYTVNYSASTWSQVHCLMFSGGLASGDPIEASNTATGTTGYPSTSVTVATLAALINAAATTQAVTTTPPTNWVEQQDTNVLHSNTRILSGTGSFTASGGTVSVNGEICVALVAIQPAASGSPTKVPRPISQYSGLY